MTAPCQACGEDPDLGAMCPVAGLRHVAYSTDHIAIAWAKHDAENDERRAEAMRERAARSAVPPSPEEMAKGAGYYAEGAPADAPMLLVRRDLFIAGILAERSRSAVETAALRTRENWLDGEVGRLRAALEKAQAAASAMKERCAKVVDDARAGYPENYSMGRDPFERRLEAMVSEIRALK